MHQAIGELPFPGSCFACVLHQAIGEIPFAGSCFACVLHQAIGELPFPGSCFACVLHQAIGELPFVGSCFACVLHQALEEIPFAGSCFACVLRQATGEFPSKSVSHISNSRTRHEDCLQAPKYIERTYKRLQCPATTLDTALAAMFEKFGRNVSHISNASRRTRGVFSSTP